MDGIMEIYLLSPDWLKLALILQPTLFVWGMAAIVQLHRRRGKPGPPLLQGMRLVARPETPAFTWSNQIPASLSEIGDTPSAKSGGGESRAAGE